jgi:hypothetical protein
MTYGGDSAKRGSGPARLGSWIFERLGVLNPGSSEAAAVPDPADAEKVGPVTSNALNVTRVGGVTALIAGAGAAALALFNVDKATDRTAIVVAAYGSVGLIVSAALLVTAIIIVADIRARATIAVATSPAAPRKRATVRTLRPTGNTVSIDGADDVFLVDAAEDDVRLELPDAASIPDQVVTIKKIDDTDHRVLFEASNGFQPRALTRKARELRIYSAESAWRLL